MPDRTDNPIERSSSECACECEFSEWTWWSCTWECPPPHKMGIIVKHIREAMLTRREQPIAYTQSPTPYSLDPALSWSWSWWWWWWSESKPFILRSSSSANSSGSNFTASSEWWWSWSDIESWWWWWWWPWLQLWWEAGDCFPRHGYKTREKETKSSRSSSEYCWSLRPPFSARERRMKLGKRGKRKFSSRPGNLAKNLRLRVLCVQGNGSRSQR